MRSRELAACAAVPAAALLVAGCGSGDDPRPQLQAGVQRVTAQANARNADGVRAAVDDLLRRTDAAVRSGGLSAAEATRLRSTAQQVRAAADSIDADLLARQRAEQAAREAQQRLQEQLARQTASPAPPPPADDKGRAGAGKGDDGKKGD